MTSVKMWVQEMNEKTPDKNPVPIYKEQGKEQPANMDNIGNEDFIIGIMTPHMETMMNTFRNVKVVCIDTTHRTNKHGFFLVTIMVINNLGEGERAA